MVQESFIIAIDNSEWMRNGDMTPTRLQCQQEAVNYVIRTKLRANPENGVGLLSMAPNVEVLSTITRDDRKLFTKLHEVVVGGNCRLVNAIKIAHLALRHRQNRNHKMRIIVFIGSPIEGIQQSEFIRLAKKLKKEKVNVDFVCFGEASQSENDEKVLQEFVDTLNSKDSQTSNLLSVNSGGKLTDALVSSPICQGEDGAIGGGGMDFGNLEEEDPELALALRVSLEEQRQRQQREAGDEAPPQAEAQMEVEQPAPQAPAKESAPEPSKPAAAADVDFNNLTEEQQLEMALKMSILDAAQQDEMDVDSNVNDVVTDSDVLQQLVNQLPDSSKDKDEKEKPKSDSK
ncbi:unnamed protein product [Bursaphelenchus xylophilus]|uniref:26S proteasome non-ATPase regulatory subunit 4 n=1 Tax=Bursaphelenchus xylophilus TaxID=6326 RepID=A0A1I7S1W5_BURXY|nr:unnamed protein product [Bursaphelenchus xylophilus]CAG9090039.1 unnamed protein product [Bursaphelenchus xylophilus]